MTKKDRILGWYRTLQRGSLTESEYQEHERLRRLLQPPPPPLLFAILRWLGIVMLAVWLVLAGYVRVAAHPDALAALGFFIGDTLMWPIACTALIALHWINEKL